MRDKTGREIDRGDTLEYRRTKHAKPEIYKVARDDKGDICAESEDGTRRYDFHLNISVCGHNPYEELEQQLEIIKRANRQLVATLQLSTYVGTSFGALHYYGKLYLGSGQEGHDLEYELSVAQAKALNKNDYDFGREYAIPMKPGEMDGRFDTPEHVRREAIAQWKGVYPEALVLVEGEHLHHGVQERVLDGPEKLVGALQKLIDRQNELGGGYYDNNRGNWKEIDALGEEWGRIVDEWKGDQR
ncbi:MAG: hypothetical protein ABID84_04730 [Chloroflexota bacterium]